VPLVSSLPPRFSIEEVKIFVNQLYDLAVTVRPLVSDIGQNFHITDQAYFIIEKMKELGILLSIDGPLHNVVKIKPPLVFSESNAEFLIDKLDEVLQDKVIKDLEID